MKVKIRNKKNEKIVKEIESNLLSDYLATKEWVKLEKEKKPSNNSNKSNLNMNEEENK